MRSLDESIRSLHPTISSIREASGSPGLSLGVSHHGKTIHTAHFGKRDLDRGLAPNDETIYHVASLTKIIAAGAVSQLVNEGILDWELPVRHYLPEFAERQDDLGRHCTLIDLLSNRSGIALANALWGQKHGEFLLPKNQIVQTACQLDAVKPFRDSFVYSQWNYALVTEIIERTTNQSFGTYVKAKLLEPLGLERTSFMRQEGDNIAVPYAISDDMSPMRISPLNMTDETGFAGGYAARSSIRDLLLLYQSLLRAYAHQMEHDTRVTEGSPFKEVATILSPYISVGKASINDVAYCLGLYRTRLPNYLGMSSINSLLIGSNRMPRIGTDFPGVEVFHHTGNVPGYFASAFLIPSTETAIVVLSNSLSFVDPTDLVGQLLVSHLLRDPPLPDLQELCDHGRVASLTSYERFVAQLERHRTTQPPQLPLFAYEGDYVNSAGNFILSISQSQSGLRLTVQDMPLTTYELVPYDGNTFYWPANRNEEIKQSMWPIVSIGPHKIKFEVDKGVVQRLVWKHDPYGNPEVFGRRGTSRKARPGKL
ncbi:MAG: hypothetical protein LQ338_005087 [Usnochroma carphineum]|nr:MAG: hypothetical protein LQ338_005087 [Usnochroma carphineum]